MSRTTYNRNRGLNNPPDRPSATGDFFMFLTLGTNIDIIKPKEGGMIKRNVIIGKAGGTAGKNSVNYKLSIPADMVKKLGVTPEDKEVTLYMEDGKIIIKKENKTLDIGNQ